MVPDTRIDADQHLFEPRGMWATNADPDERHLVVDLVDDDAGHTWLIDRHGGRIEHAVVHTPGHVSAIGEERLRHERGEPPSAPYDEAKPPSFSEVAPRLSALDEWGLDAAVCFPNYGLLIDRPLGDDPEALFATQRAWNRWAGQVAADAGGRLFPVAHVSLRDLDRLDDELGRCASAGLRLAMIPPSLVDGRPLSHRDLDRAWSSFVDHDITPVFHVAAFPHVFDDAWYADDPDPTNPVLDSVFLYTPAALCLADLAVHGVFERHPALRLGIMELSAAWFASFLLMLDGGFDFHARFNGRPLTDLAQRPSATLLDRVRVAALAYESPASLVEDLGPSTFMYSSDWPHAEGIAHPVEGYRPGAEALGDSPAAEALWSGNITTLLGTG